MGVNMVAPVPAEIETVWSVLTGSPDNCVMLSRSDGYIYYANQSARRIVPNTHSGAGYHMSKALPAPIVEERMRCIKRVLLTGRSVMLFGMIGGSGRVATFSKIEIQGESEPSVLITCSPVRGSDPEEIATDQLDYLITDAPDMGLLAALSDRELEVLRFIGQGLTTEEISKRIHRSPKTVEWHRASLGDKLAVSNRIELARIAIAAGLDILSNKTFEQLLRRLPRDRDSQTEVNEPDTSSLGEAR
jgi:DNA-binding CsgD family transcriptional regulator